MRKEIAAFGFRSIPPQAGCAGADKFAEELFTRLVERGFKVTAYNRAYDATSRQLQNHKGINLIHLKTVRAKGFDTLLHSFKATCHIILHNTGTIIHIQNGGNSIWSVPLRMFGKKVFVSQDGFDWKRGKWPWYGRLYLRLSTFVTARAPNKVIFDNVLAQDYFEKRFRRKYHFIPYGSEVSDEDFASPILHDLGVAPGDYFLFVGRFVPEKGLQYLVPAFERTETSKKLLLVGGSPNPSEFEAQVRATSDARILFPGFVYGSDVHALMRNAYAYVQPSDIEGLSPVILENMWLETPVICSDIKENLYAVGDTALTFKQGSADDLARVLQHALEEPRILRDNAAKAKIRAAERFTWEAVTDQHVELFTREEQKNTRWPRR